MSGKYGYSPHYHSRVNTPCSLIGVARHKLADHWRRAEREQRGLRMVDATEALLVRARAAFRAAYEDPEGVR